MIKALLMQKLQANKVIAATAEREVAPLLAQFMFTTDIGSVEGRNRIEALKTILIQAKARASLCEELLQELEKRAPMEE